MDLVCSIAPPWWGERKRRTSSILPAVRLSYASLGVTHQSPAAYRQISDLTLLAQLPAHTSLVYVSCPARQCCRRVARGDRTPGLPQNGAVAASTAVASVPPRRSQRALLTHWAPALGASVESHARPRMHDPGWRQPPVSEAIHACPVQAPAPGLLRSASLRTWCTSRCAVCPQISQQRIDRLGRDPPLLGARPGEKFSDLRVPGGRVSDRRCQSETPQRP